MRKLSFQKQGTAQSNIYSHSIRLCCSLVRLFSSTQEAHSSWQTWKPLCLIECRGMSQLEVIVTGATIMKQLTMAAIWYGNFFWTETAVKWQYFLTLFFFLNDLISILWSKNIQTPFPLLMYCGLQNTPCSNSSRTMRATAWHTRLLGPYVTTDQQCSLLARKIKSKLDYISSVQIIAFFRFSEKEIDWLVRHTHIKKKVSVRTHWSFHMTHFICH